MARNKKKSLIAIFPEGRRSRTGRVDRENIQYGIGEIIRDAPNCPVLCAYMRSEGQAKYTNFPPKGLPIHLSFELFEPRTNHTHLRAMKDLTLQVIQKLEELEQGYFDRK